MKKAISRFDSSLERVRRKGQERLTIMLIPHGREQIFSLQLNWQMISFLVGILLLAVALAGYGVYNQALKAREAARLRNLYGKNFGAAVSVSASSNENQELLEELEERVAEILDQFGVLKEERATLGDIADAESIASKALGQDLLNNSGLSPGSRYLPPVQTIRASGEYLKMQKPLLAAARDVVTKGFGSVLAIPLGRPFSSMASLRDSSQFGLRPDPVTGAGFEMHTGFDTAGPEGTPILATGAGIVHRVMVYDGGYGNAVVIQHPNGYYSMYAHMSRIFVRQGATVRKGEPLGAMGRTGRVTGTHLHYEIWIGSSARLDPLSYVCATDFDSYVCTKYQGNSL